MVTLFARNFGQTSRKRFSHRRNHFPSSGTFCPGSGEQGLDEFYAQQMVTICVGYPNDFGSQIPGFLGHRRRGGERCAGYLQ